MIRDEDRRKIRDTMWWSLGAAAGSLLIDAGALAINAIVLTRNVVRAATAELYAASVRMRWR